jgi:hypothetical protein
VFLAQKLMLATSFAMLHIRWFYGKDGWIQINNSLATKTAKALSILSSYVIKIYRMSYSFGTFCQ